MRLGWVLICLLSLHLSSRAQFPTWSNQVACIVYTNCTPCHYTGGPAPFVLETYSQAYATRVACRNSVFTGFMPPWHPDTAYSDLAHERILTPEERQLLIDWVNNGAPEGNPAEAPVPPAPPGGSQLNQPTFSQRIPAYTNSAILNDYRCFVMELGNTDTIYITEAELVPGNRNMVHHALIYLDTASMVYAALDAADPAPGYSNFGGTGYDGARVLYNFLPGKEPIRFPAGWGVKVPPGSRIILQMHYPPGTDGDTDSSQVNLKFTTSALREIYANPVLNHYTNIDQPLQLDPGEEKYFTETYVIPDNWTFFGLTPHMHLVGLSIQVWAIQPNQDSVPLLNINHWEYPWLDQYFLKQAIYLPAGTVLKARSYFINNANNPYVPHIPPQPVVVGENFDDEMMLVHCMYGKYQPGDEHLQIDTHTVKPMYANCSFGLGAAVVDDYFLRCFPDPASDYVQISFSGKFPVQLQVYTLKGELLREKEVFSDSYTLDIQDFDSGIYLIRLREGHRNYFAKFLKQ